MKAIEDYVPRVTSYDSSLTRGYEELFREESPFNWLTLILEEFSVSTLPQTRALSILDVACGIGSLCQRLSRAGYREVIGVDVSRAQVESCLAREVGKPTGAVFFQIDARDLDSVPRFIGHFDIVHAAWLYDTARDENDFYRIARALRRCVKPGGRHFGLDVNFAVKPSGPTELTDYGISLMDDKPPGYRPSAGDLISARILTKNKESSTSPIAPPSIVTDVTFFDESTFRRVLSEAGFNQIEFFPPQTWKFVRSWANAAIREKFERYIATNPEMIGFSAIA